MLVHGGAGSVEIFAVQMAKMKGAHILATASGQNVEFVKSLDTDEVIDYSTTPFETAAHAIDVVLDLIGGEIQQRSWGCSKRAECWCRCLQDAAAKYGVRAVLMGAQPTTGLLKELADLLDRGQIKPHVGKVFPLEQRGKIKNSSGMATPAARSS